MSHWFTIYVARNTLLPPYVCDDIGWVSEGVVIGDVHFTASCCPCHAVISPLNLTLPAVVTKRRILKRACLTVVAVPSQHPGSEHLSATHPPRVYYKCKCIRVGCIYGKIVSTTPNSIPAVSHVKARISSVDQFRIIHPAAMKQ